MDARKFFFVSLGVLSLAVAFSVGERAARADFVETNPLGIRAISGGGPSSPMVVLLESGAVIEVQGGGGFIPLNVTLPVPPSEIVAFEGVGCGCEFNELASTSYIITTSGIVWRVSGHGGWENLGALPGVGPVTVDRSSFGKIKSQHR